MKYAHNLLHWHVRLVVVLALGGAVIGGAPVFAATGTVTSSATPSDARPDICDSIVVTINIDVSGVNAPDNKLGSFTGTFDWEPDVLTHESNSGILAGFTGFVNTDDVAAGHIVFNGANSSGVTGKVTVLTITFDVVGAGTSPLDLGYSAMAAATSFANLLPLLTVKDGQVVASPAQYTLTMAANPSGGGTTDPTVGTHVYAGGTVVDVAATPATTYHFVSWTGDVANPNSASATVTMCADKAVTANFTKLGPDLSLTKADGGQPAKAGDTISYSLTYHNAGGNAAGVVINETVPANTAFNSAASTSGWVCQPNPDAGSSCNFNLRQVANAGGGSVVFAVTVASALPIDVTEISNTAGIADDGSGGADSNPANNSATVHTTIERHLNYLPLTSKDR